MTTRSIELTLSERELRLVLDALDSRAYWQLSEPYYRRDGFVTPPGSDDAETRRELRATERLPSRLERSTATAKRVA